MKGVVFTEFMELVEANWGIDMVDDLLDAVDPPSGGAYTSVATYDFQELIDLVTELSKQTESPVPDLVFAFGQYLADSFSKKFTLFFSESKNTFELLKKIDDHIHVEVRKLYPDAELPKFSYDELSGNRLLLRYESKRHLADLAHGLMVGAAKYYDEEIVVERTSLNTEDMAIEEFIVSRVN